MKQLACEMCGSSNLIKNEGVFVCQNCGCKYSVEEAKKMMVEGVVEVTGTVSIQNREIIEHHLELARNAKFSRNHSQAEEHADKVLGMDSSNYEAWFIKGYSANYQTTIANDRLVEALSCYRKSVDGIVANLSNVSIADLELIETMEKECAESAPDRVNMYGKAFSKIQSKEYADYLTTIVILQIEAAISTLQYMHRALENCDDAFQDVYEAGGGDRDTGHRMWKRLLEKDLWAGQVYLNSGVKLFASATNAAEALFEYFNQRRIFDYYGTGRIDDSPERTLLFNHWDKIDLVQNVLDKALDIIQKPMVGAYIRYCNSLIKTSNTLNGLNRLMNPSLVKKDTRLLPSQADTACKILDYKISLTELRCKSRTNRRYHNRYSGGEVTDDGIFMTDSAKTEYSADIDRWKTEKEAIRAAARKEEAERLAKEEAEQKEKNERYWSEHQEEKAELEGMLDAAKNEIKDLEASIVAAKEQIASIEERGLEPTPAQRTLAETNTKIASLQSERSKLGFFQGKQKKEIDEAILALEDVIENARDAAKDERMALKKKIADELAEPKKRLAELEKLRSDAESRRTAAIFELTKDR